MTPSLHSVVGLPTGPFKCIVADPPWDHSDGTGFSFGFRDPRGRSGKHGPSNHSLPYSVMTLAEIEALPVAGCSDKEAVLYLWTTSRFLEAAHGVARKWGFNPGTVLVWCKPQNQGLFGGTWLSNVEFIVTAKRGNLKATGKVGSRWFTWPRRKHSEKPHEFQTLVESVSPGPRLELFARRERPGWTVWGNEVPCKANAGGEGRELCERTSPPPCSASDVSAKYNELLYAVARKFPGESRHKTALRYIRQAEEVHAGPCMQNND